MARINPVFEDDFNPAADSGVNEGFNMDNFGEEMTPGGVLDVTEETPLLNDLPEAPDTLVSLSKEEQINKFYNHFKNKGYKN